MRAVEPATNTDNVSVVAHTSFAVSSGIGDMLPGSYHGYFSADTRFLSYLTLRVSGRRPERLSAGLQSHRRASFFLTNARTRHLAAGTISIFRERELSDRLRERITMTRHALDPVDVRVEIRIGVDFADIFEVRRRERSRRVVHIERPDARSIRYVYERAGHRRTTSVRSSRPFELADSELQFDARLEPAEPWELEITVEALHDHGTAATGLPAAIGHDPEGVRAWAAGLPELETHDARLPSAWRQALLDLEALLLVAPDGGYIPAAGLPWYLAVFGRDAAITARQTMLLGPDLPLGTLRQLAAYQGEVDDRFREEQPGKIPHEVRSGELAVLDEVPHARYYGSVDATPLFVSLFVEACRWSGWLDRPTERGSETAPRDAAESLPEALATLLPAVERALAWIDRYAMGPGGLVWYAPQHRRALRNQAWKDSWDSYRFADGRLADPPIAPVEVQGYVHEAKLGMADVFARLGRADEARGLRADADALFRAIDDAFWMPDEGFHAMGLDASGRVIDSVTSNPGHLLWSGAVSPERAGQIVDRLMAPDLFSGWGVRTMSSRMPAYNPVSYHNGSVWPHDTSLIAAGMARSGFGSEAWRLTDALLDAAAADPLSRLPELFAGYDRQATRQLVQYPVACAPQAWATGAIVLGVQTILGLRPGRRLPGVEPLHQAPAVRLLGARIGEWSPQSSTSRVSRPSRRSAAGRT